jgi:amino-acid N-acetyltransferase
MIRLAKEEDAGAIADFIKKHSQDDYMGYATFDKKYIIDKMKRDFFVVDGNPICGCLRLSIVYTDLAEIRTLAVEEKERGSGIGTQLLKKAMEIAKEKGMRKIVARTKASNTTAISFFRKFGFEQEGYFREHYREGIDVVQMAKFIK